MTVIHKAMLKRLLFQFLLLLSFSAFAQPGTVSAVLVDSLKKPIPSATVTLQDAKDSSLISFTLSNAGGGFSFKNLKPGDYRLLITHIAFHSKSKRFSLTAEKPSLVLDSIRLYDKMQVMPEYEIVEEAPPVTLKGDTLEFNGSSFKTAPNAVVEDLLKKMPGVEIGQDGTLKVNGQTVTKVLVDGKEFFGSDPSIATKNLPADAIDKVQVFDKKSDTETLTGMDDGSQDMAINLKLKKDKKKGVFGNVTGAYGTGERYKGKLNANRFDEGKQFSLLANANNINEQAFNFMDIMSFMGGMKNFGGGGGGGVQITMTDDNSGMGQSLSNLLSSQKKGLNDNWAAGTHFSDDWGKRKQVEFTGSYFYSRVHPLLHQTSRRQFFLPDSTYYQNTNSSSEGYTDGHRVNFQLRWKPDSASLFKLAPSFNAQIGRTSAFDDVRTLNEHLGLSNSSLRGTRSGNEGFTLGNDLLFQRGLAKKGRTYSVQLTSNYREGESFQLNDNSTTFYNDNGEALFTLEQQLKQEQSALQHDEMLKLAWTEPLGKRSLLEAGAKASFSLNSNVRSTFAYDDSSDAYLLHDLLSNSFQSDFRYVNQSLRYKYAGKKLSLTFGGAVQQSQLSGGVRGGETLFRNNYFHLLPNAQLTYNFTKYRDLRFNYSTELRAPSISNLQPVTDVSNPLYIRTGNTSLQPEQSQNLRFDFKTLNPFENKHLFVFASVSRTDKAITSSDMIDSLGITTSRPVNGAPRYSGNFFSGGEFPVRKLKSRIAIEPEVSWNRTVSYINGEENVGNNFSYRPTLRWTFVWSDKFDIAANARITITDATYSLRSESNNRFTSQSYGIEGFYEFPKKFTLQTELSYVINESSSAGGIRTEFPLWKASLAKQFTKSGRAELKLQVYDILNRNTGITRNTSAMYVEDLEYNLLRRYALLNFTWKLNKMGGGDRGGRHGMQIKIGGD